MPSTILRKVGGSVMLAVPPVILDRLHLVAGTTVELEVEGERLVIETTVKPKYTLEELLSQCNPDAPLSDEDRAWLEMKPAGREL